MLQFIKQKLNSWRRTNCRDVVITIRVNYAENLEVIFGYLEDLFLHELNLQLVCIELIERNRTEEYAYIKVVVKNAISKDGQLQLRKHLLDAEICDTIRSNLNNVEPRIIGPYRTLSGSPVTSDFFVDQNQNVLVTMYQAFVDSKIPETDFCELIMDNRMSEMFCQKWLKFAETAESNFRGKEYMAYIIRDLASYKRSMREHA